MCLKLVLLIGRRRAFPGVLLRPIIRSSHSVRNTHPSLKMAKRLIFHTLDG
jgi:hypothetical protein